MLIGYRHSEDCTLEPMSPEKQTLSVAHTGVTYRFRNYTSRPDWPFGENDILAPTFSCERISPDNELAIMVSDSLQANTY